MIELLQKLVIMVIQAVVLMLFAGGLGAAIKWCNTPPQTTAKAATIHFIAIGLIVGVAAAMIWLITVLV